MEITRDMVIRAASRLYDDEHAALQPVIPLMASSYTAVKIDYIRRAKSVLEAALQIECSADLSV